MNERHWQDWLVAIVGAWLVASNWVLGINGRCLRLTSFQASRRTSRADERPDFEASMVRQRAAGRQNLGTDVPTLLPGQSVDCRHA